MVLNVFVRYCQRLLIEESTRGIMYHDTMHIRRTSSTKNIRAGEMIWKTSLDNKNAPFSTPAKAIPPRSIGRTSRNASRLDVQFLWTVLFCQLPKIMQQVFQHDAHFVLLAERLMYEPHQRRVRRGVTSAVEDAGQVLRRGSPFVPLPPALPSLTASKTTRHHLPPKRLFYFSIPHLITTAGSAPIRRPVSCECDSYYQPTSHLIACFLDREKKMS